MVSCFLTPYPWLWYGDLTGDGLRELAVVSMGGVHILQVSATVTCAVEPPDKHVGNGEGVLR